MKKIYYNVMVKTSNNAKEGVSVVTGGSTIEEALESGFKTGTYYLGLGYRVWLTNLKGYCQGCHGSGTIRKGVRTIKYVRCQDCKGKGETETLLRDIILNKSDSITFAIK